MKKKLAQDDLRNLSILDWKIVRDSIQVKKTEQALESLEKAAAESEKNNDTLTSFLEEVVTHLAGLGEEEVLKIFRQRFDPYMREFLSTTSGVEAALKRCTEIHKRHYSNFTVTEEPDRYVVRYDPCGTAGKLRRMREVGTTKKAYPWSWGKAGVPYYCCHCCVFWEIIPTELQGYPVKITLIGDRPEDPCINLFYKKPEFIPEEYLKKIGR